MSTQTLLLLDLVLSVLAAAGWLTAGAIAAGGFARGVEGDGASIGDGRKLGRGGSWRVRGALLGAGVAILATAGRAATVLGLTSAGWWFVQEKITLTVPLLLAGGLIASLLGGPHLVAAARGRPRPGKGGGLALLSAGYAAAAGPVVTVLSGYPATWTVALVTLAVIGAASVLTARVLNLPGLRTPAVASLTAAVLGLGVGLVAPSPVDAGGGPVDGPGEPLLVSNLRGPDAPMPGGVVRRYTLTAQAATIRLPSGRTAAAWTFNGQVPGPPITAEVGDLVEVTLRNTDITDGVTLHWHGYDVPAAEDGVPGLTQDAVAPGQEYVYRFIADQPGTYWYHTHEVSDRAVKLGLYGTLVVSPRGQPTGVDLVLPVHQLAGFTVVGDQDTTMTRTVAPGTTVRLRLINTDDTPRLFAVTGTPFRLVAVDGVDLDGPGEVAATRLRLPAGGRYDVSFVMPPTPVALVLPGERDATHLQPGPSAVPVEAVAVDNWPVLDLLHYGRSAPVPFTVDSAFDRRFDLVLDQGLSLAGGRPAYAYTVNGRAFPDVPSLLVRTGDLVLMTVVNRGQVTHPWHLHGHRVLVLSRDGQAPQGSPLWLDTFDVQPGEVWRVAFRADNPGLWMNHCHNLSHAAQGMVLHLAYQGVVSSFHGGHGG